MSLENDQTVQIFDSLRREARHFLKLLDEYIPTDIKEEILLRTAYERNEPKTQAAPKYTPEEVMALFSK